MKHYPDNIPTTYEYVDEKGHIELELSEEIIRQCSDNWYTCENTKRCIQMPEIKSQFKDISDNTLFKSLREKFPYETTDDEIRYMTRETKEQYALWIACCNAIEEGNIP